MTAANPTFVLLPSPLLGGAAWEPVAEELRRRKRQVVVMDLSAVPANPADLLTAMTTALPVADVILVPHSNAGLYAPALAEHARVRATVFVDAALPTTEPEARLAPPGLLEHLAGLADDTGTLPPWTKWWTASDLSGLFPDETWRKRIERSQPRLPLSYFTSRIRVPDGWATRANAYLAFGETYAEEVVAARRHGWPVEVLADGRHLHMLHEPAIVTTAILELLRRLDILAP